jgi:hypothetical protein
MLLVRTGFVASTACLGAAGAGTLACGVLTGPGGLICGLGVLGGAALGGGIGHYLSEALATAAATGKKRECTEHYDRCKQSYFRPNLIRECLNCEVQCNNSPSGWPKTEQCAYWN